MKKIIFFAPKYHSLMIQRGSTIQNTLIGGKVVAVEKRVQPLEFNNGLLEIRNKKDAVELVQFPLFGNHYIIRSGVELINTRAKALRFIEEVFGADKKDFLNEPVEVLTQEIDDPTEDLSDLISKAEAEEAQEKEAEKVQEAFEEKEEPKYEFIEEVTKFNEAKEFLIEKEEIDPSMIKKLADAHIVGETFGYKFPNLKGFEE